MKIAIIYSSKTGNTRRVAEAVYRGLERKYRADLLDMEMLPGPEAADDYDALLIGFWVDRGTANARAKKFIQKLRGKRVGLFCTMAADPASKHGRDVHRALTERLLHGSCRLLEAGVYNGLADKDFLKRLEAHPPLFLPKPILRKMIEAGENSREPDENDFRDAVQRFDRALSGLGEEGRL